MLDPHLLFTGKVAGDRLFAGGPLSGEDTALGAHLVSMSLSLLRVETVLSELSVSRMVVVQKHKKKKALKCRERLSKLCT